MVSSVPRPTPIRLTPRTQETLVRLAAEHGLFLAEVGEAAIKRWAALPDDERRAEAEAIRARRPGLQSGSLSSRVLARLQAGGQWERRALAEAESAPEASVTTVLSRLVASGLVRRAARGVYEACEKGEPK